MKGVVHERGTGGGGMGVAPRRVLNRGSESYGLRVPEGLHDCDRIHEEEASSVITASFSEELWAVICAIGSGFASVPFAGSLIVSLVMVGAIVWYSKKRPQGAELTWGTAMVAAFYVTALMFWYFGVVPDQWMKHAEGTLAMRSDAILAGPGSTGWFEWFPVRITKSTVADFVTVNIYMIGLAVSIALWAVWQGRGATPTDEVEKSTFGRPLVKA